MLVTTRRAIVASAAVLAAGTVASALVLRKPRPEIHSPAGDAPPAPAESPDLSALVPTEPPVARSGLSFSDASGATHSLAEFAGKGIVLNLWATWCVPCVAELPSLAKLAQQVAGDGVVVLALSSDRGGAPIVTAFYRSHAIGDLGIWLDPKGEVGRALGLRGVPTTILIDRQGRERARLEGAADWSSAEAVGTVRKLVQQG